MAKCSKCGKEIPNTGEENPNWKLFCKDCGNEELGKLISKVDNKKVKRQPS